MTFNPHKIEQSVLLVASPAVVQQLLAALTAAGLNVITDTRFPQRVEGCAAAFVEARLLPPPPHSLPVVALVDALNEALANPRLPLDCVRLSETDPDALLLAAASARQRFALSAERASSARSTTESQARFHNTVTISHDGVLVLSPQGVILFANAAALDLFGRESLVGGVFGFPVSGSGITELEIPQPTGGIRAVEMRVVESEWEGRLAYLASLRDITARKQAEEALRLTARAVDASTVGVAIASATLPDMPLIYVNPAFEAITGYSASEALGRNCRFLQGSARDQDALHEVRAALREGREALVTLRNYRKDGQMFWNELRIAPITDADGLITHFVGVLNDVTRRVEAEQAVSRYAAELEQRVTQRTAELSQQKQRLETILNSVSDMVVVVNAAGYVLQVNPAFNAWFEAPVLPLQRHLRDITHPEDHPLLASALGSALTTERLVRVELTLQNRAGRLSIVDGGFSAIYVQAGCEPEIVCSFRDVSLQKQLEDGLRQALQRERELGELKARFSAMVSHEFRTPLAVILSSIGILKEYYDRLSADKRLLHLQKAESQVFRLTQLINDVLVINTSDTVGVEFRPAYHDLAALFAEIVSDAVAGANGSEDRVEFIHEGVCDRGYVDETLLRHIVFNLLSNAIKYSPPHSPILVRLSCANGQATLSVTDHGIGIPAESQPLLFQTFHRARNARSIPGTGLGLVIAKRAVDAHRGTISFNSVEGIGTTFTVTLPIQPEADMAHDQRAR